MVINEHRFGPIDVTFTTSFNWKWDDRGSGSNKDGNFAMPIAPPGFYPLGSICTNTYDSPNGKVAAICVKTAPGKSDVLKPPVDFVKIWGDHGSGANRDGSCWRPTPPPGYVALGDVFNDGYGKPDLNAIRCVNRDLTTGGSLGELAWNDQGSGAHNDFAAWSVMPREPGDEDAFCTISAETFVAITHYSQPALSEAPVYNLYLPLPSFTLSAPLPPRLKSTARPEDSEEVIYQILFVPFTAVRDDHKSIQWKVDNSPFYTIHRVSQFRVRMFHTNLTDKAQRRTEEFRHGMSTTKAKSFTYTLGVSFGFEAGPKNFKANFQMSHEWSWMRSSSRTDHSETKKTFWLETPANSTGVKWFQFERMDVLRMDGTLVNTSEMFIPPNVATVDDAFPRRGNHSYQANNHISIRTKVPDDRLSVEVRPDATVWVTSTFKEKSGRFIVVPGLCGKGLSFRSVEKPDHYLGHLDWNGIIHSEKGTPYKNIPDLPLVFYTARYFKENVSWFPRLGFADSCALSFESAHIGNHYLFQSGGRLSLKGYQEGSAFEHGATWLVNSLPSTPI